MCLITKQVDPNIAEQDITVYKLLIKLEDDNRCRSVYENFTYDIGKLYETEIKDIGDPCTFDKQSTAHIKKTYPHSAPDSTRAPR